MLSGTAEHQILALKMIENVVPASVLYSCYYQNLMFCCLLFLNHEFVILNHEFAKGVPGTQFPIVGNLAGCTRAKVPNSWELGGGNGDKVPRVGELVQKSPGVPCCSAHPRVWEL